ncbi:hypothetical protein SNOG_00649 [Parastagonospora nodorum SN15]|uniref:Zn(2)-C6 fungal-type domain-containing protein n=1 Tax=Phaeosphaeria nodorum (strain SN15 / ATCC MYA-4574 / FGSC 10173) TaxID=321614 RepID=Q0V5R5_PHANO|nr:hypothetical protein SNOG_00649 [Parastagonospora nodorum SN15]EAT92144.2 hypothetical protein SNOG_00649 [Parastagonospora nodorum SN15]
MSSSSTTSAPVKRACDRRKVKCIGEGTNPCKNCLSAGLACTYNAIPQKKGPKGSRAKVLSELRENQRNAQLAAGFPPDVGYDGRTLSTTFARAQGLLPNGLVDTCLDFFFANVYPSTPVLHRQKAQELAVNMERSTEAYCLIVSLCAYVMIHANMKVPSNMFSRPEVAQMSNMTLGHALLEESVRLSEAVPAYLECTEAQGVEIRITQQWLKAMAWQLCVCQGLVSSVTNDNCMTFKYPIEISRDLLTMTHQFSQQAMEVHGAELILRSRNPCHLDTEGPPSSVFSNFLARRILGNVLLILDHLLTWLQIEKLFDIACCLADVVAVTSFSPDAFALGPRDYVSRFLTLISTLRGGHSRYLPLLLAKLSEVLPNLPLPRSLNLPQTLPASTISMSGTGTVPSNITDDYSAMPATSSPSYPSSELIRRLAAQTGTFESRRRSVPVRYRTQPQRIAFFLICAKEQLHYTRTIRVYHVTTELPNSLSPVRADSNLTPATQPYAIAPHFSRPDCL